MDLQPENFILNETKDTDDDLSNLLDSALNDFGKNKLSDDDFDEFMANQDKAEVQKVGKDFQQMLEQMVMNMEEAKKNIQEETPFVEHLSRSSGTEAHFMETINNFLQQSNNMTNATDEEGFLKAMKNLNDSDNPMLDGIMEMIVQTALSKDLMYPAVKDMLQKFEAYLKENSKSLDKSLLEKYLEQQKILKLLALEYEHNLNPDSDNEKIRASRIAKYWMELQKHGFPPVEVVGAIPEGWMGDEDSGAVNNMDSEILKKIFDKNQ